MMDQNGEEENGGSNRAATMADHDNGGFRIEIRKMVSIEMVSVGGDGSGRMVVGDDGL